MKGTIIASLRPPRPARLRRGTIAGGKAGRPSQQRATACCNYKFPPCARPGQARPGQRWHCRHRRRAVLPVLHAGNTASFQLTPRGTSSPSCQGEARQASARASPPRRAALGESVANDTNGMENGGAHLGGLITIMSACWSSPSGPGGPDPPLAALAALAGPPHVEGGSGRACAGRPGPVSTPLRCRAGRRRRANAH